jgi:hypothetical protein
MKMTKDCYACLQRLVCQAAGLATKDEQLRLRTINEGLKVLDENFSLGGISIVVATRVHKVIEEVSGNPDPYREMKDKEIAVARQVYRQICSGYGSNFTDCLRLAALGNAIDFFRPLEATKEDMKRTVNFVIDDSKQLEGSLKQVSKVLYLADNAGEIFFDLPLIRWMRGLTEVVYVVKALPVQDDITLEDIRRAGLERESGEVMTTGTATPGIDFSLASPQFKREFEAADLIFAKGMGYYESLSELPAMGRVFHCLMVKCKPVADSLAVPVNSYVAVLR